MTNAELEVELEKAFPKPGTIVQWVGRVCSFFKADARSMSLPLKEINNTGLQIIKLEKDARVLVFLEHYIRASGYGLSFSCKFLHPEHGILFDNYQYHPENYFRPIHVRSWDEIEP